MRDFLSGRAALSRLYADAQADRIAMVRAGLPVRAVEVTSERMGSSQEFVYELLGTTRVTTRRRAQASGVLGSSATERLMCVAGLVKLVEDAIPMDRRAGFDATRWVAEWLRTEQPVLDGQPPMSYMDTAEGRGVVRRLLSKVFSGAYA